MITLHAVEVAAIVGLSFLTGGVVVSIVTAMMDSHQAKEKRKWDRLEKLYDAHDWTRDKALTCEGKLKVTMEFANNINAKVGKLENRLDLMRDDIHSICDAIAALNKAYPARRKK